MSLNSTPIGFGAVGKINLFKKERIRALQKEKNMQISITNQFYPLLYFLRIIGRCPLRLFKNLDVKTGATVVLTRAPPAISTTFLFALVPASVFITAFWYHLLTEIGLARSPEDM
jgi:hypothetical protein